MVDTEEKGMVEGGRKGGMKGGRKFLPLSILRLGMSSSCCAINCISRY